MTTFNDCWAIINSNGRFGDDGGDELLNYNEKHFLKCESNQFNSDEELLKESLKLNRSGNPFDLRTQKQYIQCKKYLTGIVFSETDVTSTGYMFDDKPLVIRIDEMEEILVYNEVDQGIYLLSDELKTWIKIHQN